MIENIHSHEGEDGQNGSMDYTFRPPKNIKQIGESTSQKKIYVEDYVFTYVKELVKKEYSGVKIAVLLGKYVKAPEAKTIVINGAVEAEEIQFDAETVLTNDTWTCIYDNIQKYFHGVEVVGWFIGGPGFLLENAEKLKKIHLDNFAGVDKTLLIYDSVEGEEAFYIYEHGGLNQQGGYYIYYDKNEDMQTYIIDHKPMKRAVEETKAEEYQEYKEEVKEQKLAQNNKSVMRLMYAVGSMMVVIVIVVVASIINNNNKITHLENAVNDINTTLTASGQYQQAAQVSGNNNTNTMDVETIEGNLNSIHEEELSGQNVAEPTSAVSVPEDDEQGADIVEDGQQQTDKDETQEPVDQTTKQDEDTTKKDEDSQAASSEVKYYTVEEGDTLVSISYKLYNSPDYVMQIITLNGIEDQDMIYEGQKLIVP